MSETSGKKLTKAQRREQLLDVALKLVREEGTDALTLGYLAERAGVSKPIAYEHFKTRSGLLIALYADLDSVQVAALLEALKRTPRKLEDVARVVSRAYMHCYTSMGPEWHAISAALKGDEEMEVFQQELVDSYVAIYCEAFAPFCDLKKEELRLRCIAICGAAEALAREMLRGRVSEERASTSLGSLIVAWLSV
ncbi:TetR/AcrR family transcriptional regulator [Pyxidicoccus fallax]|uniref:TetR/AcrR family transcriptional regulator n=1 Tax=Pyxidicoccus fallax TaxID=394095 RepID=A0A848LA40_9BACT|nr:TetR/AcrR family transcriptional regulator [Pyxidicoccus fallax]NMO15376.1 TetR/AcrR family transcriptional regulator [Pyxidicoccus fallax]NPC79218.1 TetR/AcrR family transcriptional regulator [Pyxidicoccus fallax]